MQKTVWIVLVATLAISQVYANTFRENMLNAKTLKAIEDSLTYLANKQQDNGAWLNDVGYKLNSSYRVTKDNSAHVGITSLACLAFMANGSLPNRGKYGSHVQKGLDYVLSCVHEDTGYISKNGTRMYSHAFATLFLAEVYGTTHNENVRKKLQQAINLIVNCQNEQGGWRYEPIALDADLSVTVCQIQAVRAARNVGLRVSKSCVERAVRYIRRSAHRRGGFKYQDLPMRQSRITFAVTAAGVTSLYGAGVYGNEDVLHRGLKFLMRPPLNNPQPTPDEYFFYYGHYYAVQAMFTSGKRNFRRWFPRIRDQLVYNQNPDGSWEDNTGKNCPTAIASIILQTPYRYLPIFQR